MPLKLVPPREGKTPYWYVRGTHRGVFMDRSTKETGRAAALRWLRKWRDEIDGGELSVPGEPTFLDAAVAYMAATGQERFLPPLVERLGRLPLRLVDQAAIDALALELYPTATPATRNRHVYSPISAILRHAGVRLDLRRPKGAAGRQNTSWLWPEEAFRLLDAARERDPEFGLLLTVLLYTGLRLNEALALTTSDVRLTECFAWVRRTKNDDPRPLHLPPVVVAALANHPRGLDRPRQRVFRFRKSGALYLHLQASAARAGIELPERSAFHLLRHTWATWMRRYGGLDTAGLVGTQAWRDRKSAGRYEHVVVSEEARRADLLPTPARSGSVEESWNPGAARAKRRK